VIEAAWTKKRAQNEFSAHAVRPIVWKSAKPANFKSYLSGRKWRKSRPGGRAPGGSFRNCRFEDRFHR